MKSTRILLMAAAACGMTFAQPAVPQPIVLQNATIHTVTKGTFNGSIVIKNGLIADVGDKVLAPMGARIIDLSGKHVTPGLIDCHTHIALDSTNEGSISVSSMVAMRDVVNSEDFAIYRDLAGGTTTTNLLHGSANAIGGLNVVIKMRWGSDADGLVMKEAKPGIKFALGENPKRAGQGGQSPFGSGAQNLRYPGTRMGVEDVIREAFLEARQYQAAWKDYETRRARGENVLLPRKDLKLDPLVEVLEGRRLVHAHCYRADEILMMLKLADEFGFRIHALIHVLEGYKVAQEIAAHHAGATTFSDWWAYKMEAYDAIPYNAAILTRRGVVVSLNSDDPELMRHLNQEAAKAVKYGGLSETEALALITINPARQLGLEGRVGSIELGKDADLVIFDRHPLSNYAKVLRVFIDGELYFDRERDLSRRAELETRKKALVERERQRQEQEKKEREKEKKEKEKGPAPEGARRPS